MPRLTLDKVLDRVSEVARDVAAPNAAAVDVEARWPGATIRALQDSELGGLVVPEEAGGCGYGLAALVQVCEILGRECPSSALCFGMHCVATAVIAAKATPEQVVRFLEPIAAGHHLTTLALSEPGTGSHFWLPQTTLEEVEHGWRVQGAKTFVTNGGHCDSYVVSTVAAGPGAPPGRFSCLVIDGANPALAWGPPWRGVGMRGNASTSLELRGVEVPSYALLGREGEQIWYIFNVVAPYFLTAMAGTYLGIAAAALEEGRLHLTSRRYTHDGSRLAEHPVLQHRMGVLWAQVERTRRLVRHACEEGDRGGPDALPALCSAKAEVAECAVGVVNEAMTLVGGIGYREGATLERHVRDARAAHVMAPTTDLLRTWTGRAVLGENLLAD
ncbi:MAG: acyl-CoA/acyl-ACP dehydrogenase [Actinomycetota bacterium]|nr:acyl-CoA/acyl-ACP dehydrogenase [Actinomycetota bacterium]